MNDMSGVIVPKSDQMNADDLIAGPVTITITKVAIKSGEQPVSIFYDGDNGKPYKCCKSMARIMVAAWGADASKYVGRSLTLYRDPSVKWAGMDVGGIRISHMSDIDEPMTMALTMTRSNRKPFTVRPLQVAKPSPAAPSHIPPAGTPSDSETAAVGFISKEQCVSLLSYCEQLGVNIGRVLIKVKAPTVEEIPAAFYERCIAFVDAAAKK